MQTSGTSINLDDAFPIPGIDNYVNLKIVITDSIKKFKFRTIFIFVARYARNSWKTIAFKNNLCCPELRFFDKITAVLFFHKWCSEQAKHPEYTEVKECTVALSQISPSPYNILLLGYCLYKHGLRIPRYNDIPCITN